MSTKKEKLLDSAQKFLLKGQLDRAIRDYEQVVALDPKDVRIRQKLAELLVRGNRKDEALREFEVIGKFYADNGFYLKAIAVYKQLQKIDPANLKISLTLASLNEKQGLIGNALAEYKAVFDYYEKNSQLVDGVKVLEQMQALDKENFNIRLKLAETRFKAGFIDQAYDDFVAMARELKEIGNDPAFSRICGRLDHLFPERKEFLFSIAEVEMRNGKPAAAIPLLEQLAADGRWNPKALYLLAEAFRATGDNAGAKAAYKRILSTCSGEWAALRPFIACLQHEREVDEALAILRLFEAGLSVDEPVMLAELYVSLEALAPGHPAITERLHKDDGVSCASATESVVEDEETQIAVPEVGGPDEQGEGLAVVAGEGQGEESADDFSWEDEIEITFDDDEGDGERAEVGGMDLRAPTPTGEISVGGVAAAFEEVEVDASRVAMDDWLDGETAPEPLGGDGNGGLTLDFSADELEAIIPAPTVVAKGDKYGLDGLFSAFKKGVGEQLDQGDTETHYNLGIAYKEMGLYDDAVAEFKTASQDPHRAADCITLQGICCREKGDFAVAEEYFLAGMALRERITEEEWLCLKYELALLREVMGDDEAALAEYREIFAANRDFRDTVQKIARLQADDESLDLADIELVDLDLPDEGPA